MKIVIVEPLGQQLSKLLSESDLDWTVYSEVSRNKTELIERIGDADIAAGWSIKFDKDVFDACPNLKYIAVAAVGASSAVDMDEARRRGVTVMNCPGYNSVAVAEMAVMLAIAARKQIFPIMKSLSSGEWQVHQYRNHIQSNVSGSTVALIGHGNIGKQIDTFMNPWVHKPIVITSRSTPGDIDEACRLADIVFVCCSLNEKTKGLINRKRLELIGQKGTIVNVARGAIVDEDAMFEMLKSGRLGSAGLDVFCDEPFDDGPIPQSIERFTKINNVVLTPHISGMSTTSSRNLGSTIFDNVMSCVKGSPINIYKG